MKMANRLVEMIAGGHDTQKWKQLQRASLWQVGQSQRRKANVMSCFMNLQTVLLTLHHRREAKEGEDEVRLIFL